MQNSSAKSGMDGFRHHLPRLAALAGCRALDTMQPRGIVRVFVTLAALWTVVLTAAIGFGIHTLYRSEQVRDAEAMASSVAAVILEQEHDVLLRPAQPGIVAVTVGGAQFASFDRRIRRYLQPFDIYKIKIYDRDARIVYSTDGTLIGRADTANPKLRKVLAEGRASSAIDKKGQVADLGGGVRFDANVVETYLPISNDGRTVGAFELYRDISRTYDRIQRVFVVSMLIIGAAIAVAFAVLYWPMRMGTARLSDALGKLHHLAATDPLTGVLNRRGIIAQVQELQNAGIGAGHGPGGAVIMVDIDHFKSINDTCGHPVGDEVLRRVSAILRASLRQGDLIGRYGGEEFLVMLPGARLHEASMVAERLRRAVASTDLGVAELPRPVTVSIGLSPCAHAAEDIHAVVRRADEGLYRAKADGRDCVRVVGVEA